MSNITNKASKASWKRLSGAYRPNETAGTEDLRKFIQSFQPYAEKHPTSIALRNADFSICDSNGSGNCSLAEIHNYVSLVLKQDYGSDEGLRIFRTYQPAYIIAYNSAKNIKKNARNGNGNANDQNGNANTDTFEDMDADSGGVVHFAEFCDWITREVFSWRSSLKTEKLHIREWRNPSQID